MKSIGNLFIFLFSLLVLTACDEDPLSIGNNSNYNYYFLNADSEYIIVLGDIQSYTANSKVCRYLTKSLDWIRTQQFFTNKISAVLCVGDFSNSNLLGEWNRVDNSLAILGQNICFIPVTGNHDYSYEDSPSDHYFNGTFIKNSMFVYDRNSSLLNSCMSLKSLDHMISERFEPGKLDNIVVPLNIAGHQIDILALEFGPRKEVISWADSIVSAHPERQYIFLNHEFLTRYAEVVTDYSIPYAVRHFYSEDVYTPEEVWSRLISPNDNIRFVICGHNGFFAYRSDTNEKGREVPIILFNLQYLRNGGDGYLMLLEFPKNSDDVNLTIYNAIKQQYCPNTLSNLSFTITSSQPKLNPTYIVPDDSELAN